MLPRSRPVRNLKRLVESKLQQGIGLVGLLSGSIQPAQRFQYIYHRLIRVIDAYSFLMFTKSSMDNAHVEENLRSIRNGVEFSQRFFEFIVIVPGQGRHPRLYFLG